jgi:uncharacterized protein YkwD
LAAALLALVHAPAAPANRRCAGADARPAHRPLRSVRKATLCLINRLRASHGLPRLRDNRRLRRVAIAYARDMVRQDYFAHISLRGTTLGGRLETSGYVSRRKPWAAGEALAWGTGREATPRRIVRAWMHSPGHRAILLTGRFRDAGLGIARGAPGPKRGGATYTLDLACRC